MITIIFYLSLCFLAVGGFNLGEICNNGVCNWRGDGLYNGCIDDAFLRFAHFGIGGVIDLRCAHNIQVIYVDDTNLLCSDEFILSKRDITLYMNDVKCVSKFLRSSILVLRFLTLSIYLSLQSMNVNDANCLKYCITDKDTLICAIIEHVLLCEFN